MTARIDPEMLARLAEVYDEFGALDDLPQEWRIGSLCIWKSACLPERPADAPTYRRGFMFDLPEDMRFFTAPFKLTDGTPAVAILARSKDEEYLAGWVKATRWPIAEETARFLNGEIEAAWKFHREHREDEADDSQPTVVAVPTPKNKADARPAAEPGAVVRVGCFRELGYGPEAPSIEAVRARRSPEHTEKVVKYLRGGKSLVVSPGIARDIFDGESFAGTRSLLTDGVYAWPDALAYYVDKHAVALPPEFEEHMASRGWQPPATVNVRRLKL